jgi:phosphohistidine phosphatase SixA
MHPTVMAAAAADHNRELRQAGRRQHEATGVRRRIRRLRG